MNIDVPYSERKFYLMEGRQEVWFRNRKDGDALYHILEDGHSYPVSDIYTDKALETLMSFTEFEPLDLDQLDGLVNENVLTPVMVEGILKQMSAFSFRRTFRQGVLYLWAMLTTHTHHVHTA